MNIQLASDLHLEFLQNKWPGERVIAPVPGADVLVLAGDIADGAQAPQLFASWPSHPERVPIIMVGGNHELYGHTYRPMLDKMRRVAALNNIHFLENECVVVNDTRFLGCIMWTDYRLRTHLSQAQQMEYAERSLDDHQRIRTGRKMFRAQDALDRHRESRAWLMQELAKPWAGKSVVVTHHGPHPLSVHPRHDDDVLSSAYVSDLSELLGSEYAPDLWVHGHVHDGFDYIVGRTRVVANPAGYVLNRRMVNSPSDFQFENPAFDRHLVLEL